MSSSSPCCLQCHSFVGSSCDAYEALLLPKTGYIWVILWEKAMCCSGCSRNISFYFWNPLSPTSIALMGLKFVPQIHETQHYPCCWPIRCYIGSNWSNEKGIPTTHLHEKNYFLSGKLIGLINWTKIRENVLFQYSIGPPRGLEHVKYSTICSMLSNNV
jgi:hypothetical protein